MFGKLYNWVDSRTGVQESLEEGDFKALDDLLIPMDTAVSRLPFVTINDAERNRFDNGQSVKGTCSEALGEGVSYRVYHGDDTSGIFLGVGEGVLDPKDQGMPKQEVFVNPKRRVVYPL